MKIIILCGGLGTRLRNVIGENQKTMAKFIDKPFLCFIINELKKQGFDDFVFACGYKSESIKEYFEDGKKENIKITYAYENEPLGTGGAIKNAFNIIKKNLKEDFIFVLNGDTLFKVNLMNLYDNYKKFNTDMSIVVRKNEELERYGNIIIDKKDERNGYIKTFSEKKIFDIKDVYINGGIYILSKNLLEKIEGVKISLEKELIPNWLLDNKKIGAYISDADFIDIGTPESYNLFNEMLDQ